MGMQVGYARVSSAGQELDVQLHRLADCDRVFKEKAAAATPEKRRELKKALDFVREGDVSRVIKLDRLARPVVDLSNVVQLLEEKYVDLVVLDQGIDTTTYGRLQFNVLAAIGEFERGIIRERSREGRIRVCRSLWCNFLKVGTSLLIPLSRTAWLPTLMPQLSRS